MTVKTAKERPGLAGMEAFFVIDQNRSSANWPLAKILQRHGDAETGFKHQKRYSDISKTKLLANGTPPPDSNTHSAGLPIHSGGSVGGFWWTSRILKS